ncbi:MAG: ATP-binding protein [Proteobacteria bacterium]|nr:ATP-binding protein [Pseudomonadota bacterium]
MSSVANLVELGSRYAALGLPAAARGAFVRALHASAEHDSTAARHLAELALTVGDHASAREYAREVVRRESGPDARVLLGRTQLAAGELAAARMSFSAALAAASASPLCQAQAYLGVATAAFADGDRAGGAANIMAAIDAFCEFAAAEGRRVEQIDAQLALAEELFARAAEVERVGDALERIRELVARPTTPVFLLSGLLLAAKQRHSGDVTDAEIEQAFVEELKRRPDSRATRLRIIERQLRRRHRDASARREAIESLEDLARQMSRAAESGDAAPSLAENVELAAVYFLLASAYEDDPATVGKAEECYRKGLALRPGHAAAANRLALLTLARGDNEAALAEIERALRIDAGYGLAWRNAARVLDASSPGPGLPELVERLLDAANPGAGTAAGGAAPRLVTATAEVARGDVLAGMYTRGHRLKNVLGIIGSRTRSARKLAEGADSRPEDLAERLGDLEREVTSLYDEWSTYLRVVQDSGQTSRPVVEVVSTQALVNEVVEAASAASSVPVQLSIHGPLPNLRGDRMLLREALLNIVSNAADACAQIDEETGAARGSRVEVSVRAVSSSGAPIIEIQVADDGPGISRADLARVFVPGFTTKATGSGVGLSIAERAVTAHHGRIVVDSEVDKGTRVIVILPTDLAGFATLATFRGPADPELD